LKEFVVISGKGGTGKTSIAASFVALSGHVVMADCDVDAADLHILLSPKIKHKETFIGGGLATIDPDLCTGCGDCEKLCRFDAISPMKVAVDGKGAIDSGVGTGGSAGGGEGIARKEEKLIYFVDKFACDGCGVCAYFCPANAIAFEEQENGEWYISETRFGPMVHAKLHAGAENSGKLVTIVKNEARKVADVEDIGMVIVDGSPGIGCPVISSVTGADLVLVVTEPTKSGVHDLERVLELTRFFNVKTMVTVNRFDINEEITERIEEKARENGAVLAGRIHYDPAVVEAQIEKKTVVEYSDGTASQDIKGIWDFVKYQMEEEE